MTTDQLPVIDGKQMRVERSGEADRFDQWMIHHCSSKGSWFLNRNGTLDHNNGQFQTSDDHYWPTDAAALEFLRSLAKPAVKERLTAADVPGWYEIELPNGRVVRWWDGMNLRFWTNGKSPADCADAIRFRGPLVPQQGGGK